MSSKIYFNEFAEHYTDLIGHKVEFANKEFIVAGMERNWIRYLNSRHYQWVESNPLIKLISNNGDLEGYDFHKFLLDQTQKTFEPVRHFITGMWGYFHTKPYKIGSCKKKRQGWNKKHQADSSSKYKYETKHWTPRSKGEKEMISSNGKTKFFSAWPKQFFIHPTPRFFEGLE